MPRHVPTTSMMLPVRKSPRARWLAYDAGIYFVTICTKDKRHYLGEIVDGVMSLSDIGKYLQNELADGGSGHIQGINVISFVVMPNHFHVLVDVKLEGVEDSTSYSEARNPIAKRRLSDASQRVMPALSRYVNMLKGSVTRYAHGISMPFGWQPRYHDRLVRNSMEFYRIADYIDHNVARWSADCFHSL